jgi:lysophospholipase L1-like esterase
MSLVISDGVSNSADILVIGDSTVTQSNAVVAQIYTRYSNTGYTANLLGTRGAAPYLHEGRAGWTAEKYCTIASDSDYDNPFYNDGFDFSHYMEQQGHESVGAVVIQLGINDIFTMTLDSYSSVASLEYINTMVESIKAFDSSIPVVLSLIIPPNTNGTSFADTYNTSQIDWVYHYNCIRYAIDTMTYFANTTGVYFSANNCVLDINTDINDGVHPTASGYVKLGNAIYDTLANISIAESGGNETETSELWDLASRTAVINTAASATSSRTMSDAHYYHPAAYTGAWADDGGGNYTVSDIAITSNTLALQGKKSAYGVFVPFLKLDSSKTYRFTVNATVAGFRVYLVDYDSSGVYVGNHVIVDKETGIKTYDFTPTSGYQQGFWFGPLSATVNTLCTFTELSLVELNE